MNKFTIVLISTFFLLISCSNENDMFDKKLEKLRIENDIVGLSVAIVKDSEILYLKSFGHKDLDRNLMADTNTKYRIASISKMIATTALMKLYEEGKFELDEDISNYLGYKFRNPAFPEEKITIPQLLSHTSSLRDGEAYNNFLMTSYRAENPPLIKEFLYEGEYYSDNIWSKEKGPDSNYFEYGNINYGIIGTLIEIFSGKRFDEYCASVLFDPMGLNCSFNTARLSDINDLSLLYRKKEDKWIPQVDNYKGEKPVERKLENYKVGDNGLLFGPQGSLRASAKDLAAFILMFLNEGKFNGKQILQKSTIDLMLKSYWIKSGDNGNGYDGMYAEYALGNSTTESLIPGEKMTGHSGDAYGLLSNMYFSRDKKFGIVFIANGGVWKKGKTSGWFSAEEEFINACYGKLKINK